MDWKRNCGAFLTYFMGPKSNIISKLPISEGRIVKLLTSSKCKSNSLYISESNFQPLRLFLKDEDFVFW